MLFKLSTRGLKPLGPTSSSPFIGRVVDGCVQQAPGGPHDLLLVPTEQPSPPPGFRAYLHRERVDSPRENAFLLGGDSVPITHGDVLRLDPVRGEVRSLYRRVSNANFFLVTERCDNYCLMCSQPPKERDDSALLDEVLQAIPLLPTDTSELGITGGEPALLGHRFLELIRALSAALPSTSVHVLTNGRRFKDASFATALGSLRHPDLMLGVPLYSDVDDQHDYVVQARGAFDETIQGIVNLKRAGVRIELRVVVHAKTFERLPDLATFIARNLLFVDHVALMGLEIVGFARANLNALWVDPLDYHPQLVEAVRILARAGCKVSIYNHQLCVLPLQLHSYARASISDWKNKYFEECAGCRVRSECGGFFASADVRRSRGIRSLT